MGVATGVLSAAFGVGGAVLSTPGIRALGASAILAIGSTLPSILPSAASGTARYLREELIDWRVVRWTVPTGVLASIAGSLLAAEVPGEGHALMLLTAALLGMTAYRMVPRPARMADAAEAEAERASVPETDLPRHAPRRSGLTMASIGVAAGGLSGLLGVGGGIVLVPGFIEVLGMPLKSGIATSLVCVGLFAVPGTITHALLDHVDWRFATLLAIGVIPGARLGAVLAIRATDRRLRLAVASFLGVIAVSYAVGELVALIR